MFSPSCGLVPAHTTSTHTHMLISLETISQTHFTRYLGVPEASQVDTINRHRSPATQWQGGAACRLADVGSTPLGPLCSAPWALAPHGRGVPRAEPRSCRSFPTLLVKQMQSLLRFEARRKRPQPAGAGVKGLTPSLLYWKPAHSRWVGLLHSSLWL